MFQERNRRNFWSRIGFEEKIRKTWIKQSCCINNFTQKMFQDVDYIKHMDKCGPVFRDLLSVDKVMVACHKTKKSEGFSSTK